MPRTSGERRRITQAEARQYQQSYQGLVADAPFGIYRSSLDGRFVEVNPALVRMLGYDSAEELLAVDLARDIYTRPEDRARLIGQVEHAPHEDPRSAWRTAEVEWRRRDGTAVMVRLSGSPARDERGAVVGFQMMVEDITERRQLEERLRQSQKMEAIGQLTAGIAHDFNNLLTVILANLELVRDALPGDREDLVSELMEIRNAARRGGDMVRKLSAFGRRDPLALRAVDLRTLVGETVRMLRRVLPASIEVRCQLDPEPRSHILGDPAAIEQILLNLTTNARDAMREGGVVEVRLDPRRLLDEDRQLHRWVEPGDYLCVTVSDNGCGMEKRTLERLFEPFFTTKERGEGTGLGMAMVYGLVKQQAGFIHVYSEVGAGTVVRVYFPVAGDEVRSDTEEAAAHLPGGTEVILLVEDDPNVLRAGTRLLGKRGYRVLAASDGVDGLERARRHGHEIALIITDLIMPRMGGRQLIETLQAEGMQFRTLFTSGYTAGMLRGDSAPTNYHFLQKPWTADELVTKVREVLDRG